MYFAEGLSETNSFEREFEVVAKIRLQVCAIWNNKESLKQKKKLIKI